MVPAAIVAVILLAVAASFRLTQLMADLMLFPNSEKSIASITIDRRRKPTAIIAGTKAILLITRK